MIAAINLYFVEICKIFDVLRYFFKFPLKFPRAVPLPVLDTRKSVFGTSEKSRKFLKFFAENPKVPQNPAVTGLDVVKKSQFSIAVYRFKNRFQIAARHPANPRQYWRCALIALALSDKD